MSNLPCPPQHWSRFSALLDVAMDLPPPARTDWLSGLHGEDAACRPWLEHVLGSAAVTTGALLDRPHQARLPGEGFSPGDILGPYKLEALLGEGGMGQVWRATRRDDGPRRDVALKLPQPELLGGPFRARFRRERDVLASLTHPNIAQLYDAGVSAEGHPYLTLELIQGDPVTDYCSIAKAPLDRRLELMGEVLAALSYAHARLIVHRDIKPTNVMVTHEGVVKLLDFGIAKLLRAEETEDVIVTQPAAVLATPGYAAPEQFNNATVTVAADVFSAGVLLFQLVTGHRPFNRIPTDPEADAAPLASQRAEPVLIAAPEGPRLRAKLRGDLDAVIAKALSLRPSDRYASAESFARDLRRCREGLPVTARRVGWATITAKFVRRNKPAVALAGILVIAIAAGTGGIAWQARRATREAARATAVKDFMINLFFQGDPRVDNGKPSPNRTAMELLNAGAEQAHKAFANDPKTERELLYAFGTIYDSLGETERSHDLLKRRVDLDRAINGPADPQVIDSTCDLAWSDTYAFRTEEALALLETIRNAVFTSYGPQSLQRATWLTTRAQALRATHGGLTEAMTDAQQAVAILDANFPLASEHSTALLVLAGKQYDYEQFAASMHTMDRVRDAEKLEDGFDPMDQLTYRLNTATDLERMGKFAEAEAVFQQGQDQAARLVGKNSGLYVGTLNRRAEMAHLRGDRPRAATLYAEANAMSHDKAGALLPHVTPPLTYADSLAREGRAAEALPMLQDAVVKPQQRGGAESWLRHAQGALGDAYDQLGRTDEARPLLQTARDSWIKFGPATSVQSLNARERWARFLLDHGDTQAATAEYNAIEQAAGATPSAPLALSQAGLARIALAANNPAEAATASAAAMQTLDKVTVEFDIRTIPDIQLIRAETLLATGHKPEAASLADRALKAATQYDAPASGRIARANALVKKIAATA